MLLIDLMDAIEEAYGHIHEDVQSETLVTFSVNANLPTVSTVGKPDHLIPYCINKVKTKYDFDENIVTVFLN